MREAGNNPCSFMGLAELVPPFESALTSFGAATMPADSATESEREGGDESDSETESESEGVPTRAVEDHRTPAFDRGRGAAPLARRTDLDRRWEAGSDSETESETETFDSDRFSGELDAPLPSSAPESLEAPEAVGSTVPEVVSSTALPKSFAPCPKTTLSNPEWLPAGWTTIQSTRQTGNSAGTHDKYYIAPVSFSGGDNRREAGHPPPPPQRSFLELTRHSAR